MPIEVSLPKYALIVNSIQERIGNGTYAPGVMLPSESDLMREFGASRPIVVRALDLLRQDGWIESQQGKGRFVLGSPARAVRQGREHAYGLLTEAETGTVQLLSAGPMPAPNRAAIMLGIEPGTPVIARRRLVSVEGVGPVELGTAYLTEEFAAGTDVAAPVPLVEGLLRHVAVRKGVRFDHAAERISARLPSAEESRLLEVGRRDPLLTVLMAVCDRTAKPLVAVDVVLPATRHELEDVFPID